MILFKLKLSRGLIFKDLKKLILKKVRVDDSNQQLYNNFINDMILFQYKNHHFKDSDTIETLGLDFNSKFPICVTYNYPIQFS
jgi:hypothetical protein